MYCKFYHLKERPFNVTSDPAFFFLSRQHKEALSHLLYGASQRKGIMVLTGEIGTGKTTLSRFFLNQLGKNIKTAVILNPCLTDTQLLEAIARDFGLNIKDNSRLNLSWELNKFLLRQAKARNNTILLIDEAQNLDVNILEQIRLLSNLETEKEKLLQVILVGQPELNSKIELHELRQLRQRIMVKFHISPLGRDEINDYIRYRLNVAGGKGIVFADEAIDLIANFSNGTPRLVNVLCDRALLAGFVQETRCIDAGIINKCLEELDNRLVGECH